MIPHISESILCVFVVVVVSSCCYVLCVYIMLIIIVIMHAVCLCIYEMLYYGLVVCCICIILCCLFCGSHKIRGRCFLAEFWTAAVAEATAESQCWAVQHIDISALLSYIHIFAILVLQNVIQHNIFKCMYCTYRQGKHNAAQLRNGYDYVVTTVCMQFVQLIVRQIGREKGRECEKAREYGRKGRGGGREQEEAKV